MYHSIHIKYHMIQPHKEKLPTMQQPLSFLYHRKDIYLTRRVSHMKQEMLTLHHHLGSSIGFLVFRNACVAHRFSVLYCVFCFVCLSSVFCAHCCQCRCILHSYFQLRFSLTFLTGSISLQVDYSFRRDLPPNSQGVGTDKAY